MQLKVEIHIKTMMGYKMEELANAVINGIKVYPKLWLGDLIMVQWSHKKDSRLQLKLKIWFLNFLVKNNQYHSKLQIDIDWEVVNSPFNLKTMAQTIHTTVNRKKIIIATRWVLPFKSICKRLIKSSISYCVISNLRKKLMNLFLH